jgi:hypothetical protein
MQAIRYIAAICAALGITIGIGWIAFQVQQHEILPGFFFPLVFPLLLGGIVGAATMAVLRWLRPHTALRLVWTCLFGVAVVIVQSWFSYRFYVEEIERQLSSHAIAVAARAANYEIGAQPFHRFLITKIGNSGGWWIADAAIVIAASSLIGWFYPKRQSRREHDLCSSQA